MKMCVAILECLRRTARLFLTRRRSVTELVFGAPEGWGHPEFFFDAHLLKQRTLAGSRFSRFTDVLRMTHPARTQSDGEPADPCQISFTDFRAFGNSRAPTIR